MRKGLTPLYPDRRDFKLGAVVRYPKLEDLPKEFQFEIPFPVKNQRDTVFCSAFATCGMSELQEGVELEPAWSMAASDELSGRHDPEGQDMRYAMQSHVRYGAIEKRLSSFSVDTSSQDFLRRFSNWPAHLADEALKHAKSSYVNAKGPYDAFDNIRCAIWLGRDKNQAVGIGVQWSTNQYEPMVETIGHGFGHMLYAIGWKEVGGKPYLTVVNSWGDNVGDQGKFYFTREVINAWVPKYGAMLFNDMSPEEYKDRLRPWYLRQLKRILELLLPIVKTVVDSEAAVKEANTDSKPESKPEPPKISRAPEVAKAIQEKEGWFAGSRSFRNNNPGNLKYTTYTASLGATGYDSGNFCIFPDYRTGFDALVRFVEDAGKNRLARYKNCTIKTFCETYAPSADRNDPVAYAIYVANRLGVLVETPLSTLI